MTSNISNGNVFWLQGHRKHPPQHITWASLIKSKYSSWLAASFSLCVNVQESDSSKHRTGPTEYTLREGCTDISRDIGDFRLHRVGFWPHRLPLDPGQHLPDRQQRGIAVSQMTAPIRA